MNKQKPITLVKGDRVIIALGNREREVTVASVEGDLVYFNAYGTRICGSRKDVVRVVQGLKYPPKRSYYFPKNRR